MKTFVSLKIPGPFKNIFLVFFKSPYFVFWDDLSLLLPLVKLLAFKTLAAELLKLAPVYPPFGAAAPPPDPLLTRFIFMLLKNSLSSEESSAPVLPAVSSSSLLYRRRRFIWSFLQRGGSWGLKVGGFCWSQNLSNQDVYNSVNVFNWLIN